MKPRKSKLLDNSIENLRKVLEDMEWRRDIGKRVDAGVWCSWAEQLASHGEAFMKHAETPAAIEAAREI